MHALPVRADGLDAQIPRRAAVAIGRRARDHGKRAALRRPDRADDELALAGDSPLSLAVLANREQPAVVDERKTSPVGGPARVLTNRQAALPPAVCTNDVDREGGAVGGAGLERHLVAGRRPDGASLAEPIEPVHVNRTRAVETHDRHGPPSPYTSMPPSKASRRPSGDHTAPPPPATSHSALCRRNRPRARPSSSSVGRRSRPSRRARAPR